MIKRASYGNMDWLDALSARSKPRDPSSDLGQQNEADLVNNALESTAQAAFNLPVNAETKNEALVRASKEISDKHRVAMDASAANNIRKKLADAEIDPVALNVHIREANGKFRPLTKEEWNSATDSFFVEKIATAAATAYEENLRHGWEDQAKNQPARHLSSNYDPMTMRDGRIMSSTAAGEDVCSSPSKTPLNTNSIWDPFKLDRFAEGKTDHDIAVAKIRVDAEARLAERKMDFDANMALKSIGDPMKHGHIQHAGGQDRDVFVQRTPANQISMMDHLPSNQGDDGKPLPPEVLKERLAAMFAAKIPDNGASIRAQNDTRKAEISRGYMRDGQGNIVPTEQSSKYALDADGNVVVGKNGRPVQSWETTTPPASTSDIQRRLTELWLPPAPKE